MTLPIACPAVDTSLMLTKFGHYVSTTWWKGKSYGNSIPTLVWTNGDNFSQELAVRSAAMNAFTLATIDYTRAWTPGVLPTWPECARLISAVSRQHFANAAGVWQEWGSTWQSPLWAAWCGLAAMLAWDQIPNSTERQNVQRMLVSEADYVVASRPPLFWKDATDVELRPGDSAAEENSWCAMVLWVASALMPTHPNADDWIDAAIDLNLSSFCAPQDLDTRGYNVTSGYLVMNHNKIHPDYMTTAFQNTFGKVAWKLIGRNAPEAALFNVGNVWGALQTEGMDAANTVAYNPTTPNISFPIGTPNDWGNRRPAAYATFDGLMQIWPNLVPSGIPLGPWYWSAIHGADLAAMQARPSSTTHPTGSFVDTAVTPVETTYPEENAYSGCQLAYLHLARHLFV